MTDQNDLGGTSLTADAAVSVSAADAAPHAASHTPGPWSIRRASMPVDGEYDYAIYDAHRQVIAETFGRTSVTNRPDSEANAHLIAAAPELYKFAKSIQRAICAESCPKINGDLLFHCDLCKEASDAIAKAEGREVSQ